LIVTVLNHKRLNSNKSSVYTEILIKHFRKQYQELLHEIHDMIEMKKLFFLILTQFNTHYESMQDSIYCSERCASAALFSHQKSLLSAFYIITVFNARTL